MISAYEYAKQGQTEEREHSGRERLSMALKEDNALEN